MHPVLFHLGSFPVRSYGAMIIVGFLLALWRTRNVCQRRMETEPEDSPRRVHPDTMTDIGIATLMAGLIGARLLFVLLDWKSFAGRWLDIPKIWAGGLSLHGSLIGGLVYIAYAARRHKIRLSVLGDLIAPAFAIAYAFGRIGCFLNGCCYGNACSLPWGVRFPDEHGHGLMTMPSHPVQLYGSIATLVFFAILRNWERKPYRDGELFFGMVAMYGLYRGVADIFRVGATSDYLIPALSLTLTQVISLLMLLGGVFGVFWLRRTRPARQDAVFAPATP